MDAQLDAEIVSLIRDGDEKGLEELVRRYSIQLTEFAFDYVKSADVAEDIVADLFVWIWMHRGDMEPRTSIRSYLFGAVRNRALNVLRSERFRNTWSERYANDPGAAGIGQPQVALGIEGEDTSHLLRAAIDSLSPKRREAVMLRWLRGLSYGEIAEVTGSTLVGVKQQLNRAIKDLRARIPKQ